MIRGKKRPLPVAAEIVENVPKVEAKMNASIHNRFDIEVIDSRTGEVRQRAQAENIVLNQLWNNMGKGWSDYIHYGSGNGTPSAADTSLFTYKGNAAASVASISNKPNLFTLVRKIVLSPSTAVGVAITEVGLARTATSTTLCTHAMLQDMNGNQISILKTDTDIINIFATVFLHMPDIPGMCLYSLPGVVMYQPEAPWFKFLCGEITSYWTGPLNSFQLATMQGGSAAVPSVAGNMTFDVVSKKYVLSPVRFDVGVSNIPDIKGINAWAAGKNGSNSWRSNLIYISAEVMGGGSTIIGDVIGTGDGVSTDFQTTFSEIHNGSVYLDGAKQTDGIAFDMELPFFVKNNQTIFRPVVVQDDGGITPVNYSDITGSNKPITVNVKTLVLENLYADTVGIVSFMHRTEYYSGITDVQISDDGITWQPVSGVTVSPSVTRNIPAGCENCKYLKIISNNSGSSRELDNFVFTRTSDNNIHFTTPPPVGAVITADYHTATIAKDENHVFDFSMTIQLGEYVPTN